MPAINPNNRANPQAPRIKNATTLINNMIMNIMNIITPKGLKVKRITWLSLILLTFLTTQVFAGLPPTRVQEESGTLMGPVFNIDCQGAAIECTHSGTTMVLDASGAGAGSGDVLTVNSGSVDTTANIDDSADITWALVDGGSGGPDDVRGTVVDNSHSHTESNVSDLSHTPDEVGTLTNTKWCTTDGSVINCTEDAPAGGGTDDQVIDVFSVSGNNIQLSLEDDGEATKTVDVSTTTAVTANTAKVTNATHTGDVTGATALTIAAGSVHNSMLATDVITGAAAVGTFASGDTFLCNEAGVGVRECDYDDLPAGGGGSADGAVLFSNLKIENGTTSATQVDVTADYVALFDATDNSLMATAVSVTCTIATSGINGLEASDSEAGDTWYEIYIMSKDDGTEGCLLNTAGGAITTTPTDYDNKFLVGYVRNDGSSNFLPFMQWGIRTWFDGFQTELTTGGATTYTNVDVTSSVPPNGHSVFLGIYSNATSGYTLSIRADGAANDMVRLGMRTAYDRKYTEVPVSNSQILEYKNSGASKQTDIEVVGYAMNL